MPNIEFPGFSFRHDICNDDRAAMVEPLVSAFKAASAHARHSGARHYYYGPEIDGAVIGDIIVDLLHLFDRLDPDERGNYVDVGEFIGAQLHHYEEERNEELPGCEECEHTGYLLGQTYENIDWPDGWSPIQRCDTCDTFEGDDTAAAFYATRFGTESRWVEAEGNLPGDYIVRLPT